MSTALMKIAPVRSEIFTLIFIPVEYSECHAREIGRRRVRLLRQLRSLSDLHPALEIQPFEVS
jgi:hypothetical protein